ncbi:hypothetical protein QFZ96_006872 [Paraburkholderia youngii]
MLMESDCLTLLSRAQIRDAYQGANWSRSN